MPLKRSIFRVRTAAQLRMLNSPARLQVFEALREVGQASAAELATRAGVRPEAVHYHLRKLEVLGLAREAGRRSAGRKPEVLFAVVADRILLDPERETQAYRRERVRGTRLFLRRAEREISAAMGLTNRGERCGLRASLTRDVVRLSASDFRSLRRLLAEVDRLLQRADHPEKPHRVSVTIAVAPLHAG